ncbi:Metallo-dependent phosphatase [Daldinia bambusicola]|nr:Metallo-dependent phosphatase [Daldinia bambusicola]
MGIKTRSLIISDTHVEDIPNLQHIGADVAIYCGDLFEESNIEELKTSLQLLTRIDAPLKKKVAENLDLQSEEVEKFYGGFGEVHRLFEEARGDGVILLEEGTHWFYNWGFQYNLRDGHEFAMEKGVDVVITHGPPHGIMYFTDSRCRAGCPQLFSSIARARPRLHCFGNIHGGWGAKLVTWRDRISEVPSHFTDIDSERSTVIEELSNLNSSRMNIAREGHIKTSYCTGDDNLLQASLQTFLVNAAIQGVTEE